MRGLMRWLGQARPGRKALWSEPLLRSTEIIHVDHNFESNVSVLLLNSPVRPQTTLSK